MDIRPENEIRPGGADWQAYNVTPEEIALARLGLTMYGETNLRSNISPFYDRGSDVQYVNKPGAEAIVAGNMLLLKNGLIDPSGINDVLGDVDLVKIVRSGIGALVETARRELAHIVKHADEDKKS